MMGMPVFWYAKDCDLGPKLKELTKEEKTVLLILHMPAPVEEEDFEAMHAEACKQRDNAIKREEAAEAEVRRLEGVSNAKDRMINQQNGVIETLEYNLKHWRKQASGWGIFDQAAKARHEGETARTDEAREVARALLAIVRCHSSYGAERCETFAGEHPWLNPT